jgi:hypothetical protein
MNRTLLVRAVIAGGVVVLLAVFAHLWWLALLYIAFWGFLVLRTRRRNPSR